MTLQDLADGVQLYQRRLIQTYKDDVEKIKNSDFLKDEGEVQKIAQEALEIYRKDKEGIRKRIKDYNFDIMVFGIAGALAEQKMATDFPYIKTRAQELENEEGIKKFISEGEQKDYKRDLWKRDVLLWYTSPIGVQIRNMIASHISPVLAKEIRNDEGTCTIM